MCIYSCRTTFLVFLVWKCLTFAARTPQFPCSRDNFQTLDTKSRSSYWWVHGSIYRSCQWSYPYSRQTYSNWLQNCASIRPRLLLKLGVLGQEWGKALGILTPLELGGSKTGKGGNKTQATVLHLMNQLPWKGHIVYFDNLFTSNRLLELLRD